MPVELLKDEQFREEVKKIYEEERQGESRGTNGSKRGAWRRRWR